MPARTALNGTKCAWVMSAIDAGERRLARAGRAPEDDRLQQVALDGLAQWLSRCEYLFLAHHVVERARPHPLGQAACRRHPFATHHPA